MLFLVFQIGNDRYALEARHAVEVIPFVALKQVPHPAPGIAGIFIYRGQLLPALDLCALWFGRPARELLSTRIIVVSFVTGSAGEKQIGLIAERATGMMRREPEQLDNSAMNVAQASYLGPVLMDEQGVIQVLNPEHLLGKEVRQLLQTQAESLAP